MVSVNLEEGKITWKSNLINTSLIKGVKGIYFTISEWEFVKIDTNLQKIEKIDIEALMKGKNIKPSWKNTYYNGKIYISDRANPQVSVFDVRTHQIEKVWNLAGKMQEVGGYIATIDTPFVTDTGIFVKDRNNTLWILEERG